MKVGGGRVVAHPLLEGGGIGRIAANNEGGNAAGGQVLKGHRAGVVQQRFAQRRQALAQCLGSGRVEVGHQPGQRYGAVLVQPGPLLEGQHAAAAVVDAALGNAAGVEGGLQAGQGQGNVGAELQHVVAGKQGPHVGFAGRKHAGHAFHVHGIGENKAPEAHFLLQQPLDDGFGERTRPGRGVEGGYVQVGHHHPAHAAVYQGAEGRKFERIEAGAGLAHFGQGKVRVDGHVAVAGEVLGHGQHARGLHAQHILAAGAGHGGGPLAKTAKTDDGVERVVVHIDDRGKIDVHPQPAKLLADGPAHLQEQA